MAEVTWENLARTIVDKTKIADYVAQKIKEHNEDESAHSQELESLWNHRTADILDHIDEAVRNGKIYRNARAYTALVEAPTLEEVILHPNGSGDETNIAFQYPDSGSHFDKVDEATPDEDDTYVYINTSGGVWERDLYNIENIDWDEPINAVRVGARVRSAALSEAGYAKVCIKTHGVVYESPVHYIGSQDYATFEYGWPINPYTNELWTKEEINDLQIGVVLSSVNDNREMRCTQVYAVVEKVTDPGKGDFFNISAAVQYVKNLGGGIVFIQSGNFNLSADVLLADNVSLIGFDKDNVIIDFGNRDISIRGVGDDSPYSAGTIAINHGSSVVTGTGTSWATGEWVGRYIKINNVWYKIASVDSATQITLEKTYYGANISGASYEIAWLIHGIEIKNLTIKGQRLGPSGYTHSQGGIHLKYVIDSSISFNVLEDNEAGVYLDDCDGINLSQNIARNNLSEGFYSYNSSHLSISYNDCSNNQSSGVSLNSGIYNVVKYNKILNVGTYGIYCDGVNNCLIEGNVVDRVPTDGTGILLSSSNYVVVVENVFNRATYEGIDIEGSDYCMISGNVCVSNEDYGIMIYGDYNVVTNNQVRLNTSGQIDDEGTGNVVTNNNTT